MCLKKCNFWFPVLIFVSVICSWITIQPKTYWLKTRTIYYLLWLFVLPGLSWVVFCSVWWCLGLWSSGSFIWGECQSWFTHMAGRWYWLLARSSVGLLWQHMAILCGLGFSCHSSWVSRERMPRKRGKKQTSPSLLKGMPVIGIISLPPHSCGK